MLVGANQGLNRDELRGKTGSLSTVRNLPMRDFEGPNGPAVFSFCLANHVSDCNMQRTCFGRENEQLASGSRGDNV